MKRILHSLFYILLLSLSLGGLAGASLNDDDTSFFLQASYDVYVYDHEASSDTDDVVATAVVLNANFTALAAVSLFLDTRLHPAACLPDARGPPRIL